MTTFDDGLGLPYRAQQTHTSAKPFLPMRVQAVLGALTVLSTAVFGLLTAFEIGHWTAAQITLVGTALAAFWAFVTAVLAHVLPKTPQQPVAVAGTFTAFVTATLSLGAGFGWWHVTEAQNAALNGIVTALVAVGSALFARTVVVALPDRRHIPGG
ncbi:hypothetical protein ACWDTI_19195 [Gordonia sp. NPDC003424]